MDLKDKVAVVTGAAGGIGLAVAKRFAEAGAKVAISDLNADKVMQVAEQIGALGVVCDVTREDQVKTMIAQVQDTLGPIDVFHSNAGVGFGEPDTAASASNETWQLCWDVHVMAHVYASRALLPGMIERGQGYLISTASAAGLLNQIGDAAYSATKHAAVSFAESLAIAHGDQGIKVSVICPQYVATPMLGFDAPADAPDHPNLIKPDDVADTLMHAMAEGHFRVLPHPDVAGFAQLRTADPDRWLGGMRKLRRKVLAEIGTMSPAEMHKLV